MNSLQLRTTAAMLALFAAIPAVAQTSATVPAPAPVTTTPPPTVGPAVREAVVEPETRATTDSLAPIGTTPPPKNSQGAAKASVNGAANASPSSALANAGKPELNAVAGGTAVIGTGGSSIGTVTGRVKNQSGATVGLQVKLANGTTATIPANDLTLSGTTLATTWVPKK